MSQPSPHPRPPGKTVTQKTDPSFSYRVTVLFGGPTARRFSHNRKRIEQGSTPIFYFVFAIMVGNERLFQCFIEA